MLTVNPCFSSLPCVWTEPPKRHCGSIVGSALWLAKDEYEKRTAWKATHHMKDRATCRIHTSTQGLECCEMLYKEGILTPSSISIIQTSHTFSDIKTSQSSYINKPSTILIPQSSILQHHTRVKSHAFHHHHHRRPWLRPLSCRCPIQLILYRGPRRRNRRPSRTGQRQPRRRRPQRPSRYDW